jgi:MATE family multidrug resistance protein
MGQHFAAEFRELLRLGAPMVATQFFIMAMGFIDTVMAGRYASTHLAGVALGGTVLWPMFMLTTGVTMAITPIVAQLRGAARTAEAGAKVRQGLWIALFASMFCIAVISNARPLFELFEVDAEAARIAEGYLAAAAWGIPAAELYIVLRYTWEGLGRTLPPMLITGLALPVNAFGNYVLIYGAFGAPELGGVGCGWATTIVWWLELLLIGCLIRSRHFAATGFASALEGPRLGEILGILRIGAPIGATVFLEMAVFSVVGLAVASLGVTELAANSIAGNVNWATYVFPMALGSAASIRVGYYVGARDLAAAAFAARTAFIVSLGYACIVSSTLILACTPPIPPSSSFPPGSCSTWRCIRSSTTPRQRWAARCAATRTPGRP